MFNSLLENVSLYNLSAATAAAAGLAVCSHVQREIFQAKKQNNSSYSTAQSRSYTISTSIPCPSFQVHGLQQSAM